MLWKLTVVYLCHLIPYVRTDTTLEPQHTPTGILHQFQGYRTPRPFPANANFMYASVWASWSAWSFCANGVQVRVRACNTVRGFSCLGANRETKDCENPSRPQPLPQPGNQLPRRPVHTGRPDYDTIDPYDDDRKEALKQLGQYSDYEVPELKNQKPQQELKLLGEKTAKVLTPQGPSRLERPEASVEPSQAPSMTPEKLYGKEKITKVAPQSRTTLTTNFAPSSTSPQIETTQREPTSSLPTTVEQTYPTTGATTAQTEQLTQTVALEPSTVHSAEVASNIKLISTVDQHFKEPPSKTTEIAAEATAPVAGVASIHEAPVGDINEENIEVKQPGHSKISIPVSPVNTVVIQEDTSVVPTSNPTTTTVRVTEATTQNSNILNADTFKALEWMLNNMTNAAKTENSKKVHQMNLDSNVLHSGEIIKTLTTPPLEPQKSFASRIHKIPTPLIDNDHEDGFGNDKLLQQELIRLKSTMDKVEYELKELEQEEFESERPTFNTKKATELSLIPLTAPRLNQPEMLDSSVEVVVQNQREASWSNWGEWGNCLCGKQMRTRTCNYGVYSGGCVGRSYQSRQCRSYDDSSCPITHSHENGLVSTLHDGSLVRRQP
ncbi:unnamed protein product [Bursaphelenchus okinawaensis]|uniref:Uncharacterized protein n=1 Tax=Bursaphelenchus okinawaensis TaxID=465554 RepID=A0A811L930_9BILA|nr:unnamed protein product [Bursaphelenchus okinawaensis]CAG9119681.1 unnamed protein product [Bursaphelenchus okinawaensis]